MIKKFAAFVITSSICVSFGAAAIAKDVKVKAYTKKDGTEVEAYTKHVTDPDKTKVKGYTKKDGTAVDGYERKKPNSAGAQ